MKQRWTAARVQAARKRLALTQEQFAGLLGVTFATVNRWEAGHSSPRGLSVRALDALAMPGDAGSGKGR